MAAIMMAMLMARMFFISNPPFALAYDIYDYGLNILPFEKNCRGF
ncbi:hypothetical protein ASZ90_012025 [hydrocarbon metagenome]|jgi:hypothetical protein|uniref:Uncharacterized protein n=1 Tax=hydrocarbon metagenome TaxID=938273 RepID=A0A0W8FBN1_9ZZZZ